MCSLGEVVIIALFAQPAVERDESKLFPLCPLPSVCRYLCLEDLNRRHHVVQGVMRPFEGMAVVTGIGRGEVIMQFLAGNRVYLSGCVDALEQQGVVPCATVERKVQAQALKIIMQDRRIVAVPV